MIPTSIILHCSDTEDGYGNSTPAIKKYHMDQLGFKDIGYHYLLERVAGRIIVQLGRSHYQEGAHCKAGGKNANSLGVCVVGKFDHEPPDPAIYGATTMFLAALCFTFGIHTASLYGHRDWELAKTCPGMCWDMDRTRADVERLLRREPSVTGLHLVL